MTKALMVVLIVLLIISAFILGVRFSGNEDAWICKYGQWVKHGNPSDPRPTTECLTTIVMKQGTIIEVKNDLITVKNTDNQIDKIIVDLPTVLEKSDTTKLTIADFYPGFLVSYEGKRVNTDTLEGTKITLLRAPNIIVTKPAANDVLVKSFSLEGMARTFENHVAYRLKDDKNNILATDVFVYNSADAGIFGNFKLNIKFTTPKAATGTLEVYQGSAKDGSEIDKVTIPVRFDVPETIKVKVYFNNNIKDPGLLDCSNVYAVEREIAKTPRVGEGSLLELFKGPTAAEVQAGYLTNLPSTKIELKSLTIKDGIAYADFNSALEQGVGGSCKVAAIRAQITETLKQFPTVKSVIISIEGKTGDILQP